MSNLHYTLVKNEEGEQNLTVFFPGKGMKPAHSTHPNWDAILAGVLADDPSVIDLFDVAITAGTKFENLSERVSVANGKVFFDGTEMASALTDQIVEFCRQGVDDWKPLVSFYEKIETNPNPHSREHLFKFIEANQEPESGAFTITPDGDFIAYKGVESDGNGGFQSTFAGKAIVDNVVVEGKIPNKVGSTVQMPRDEVIFDPHNHCSVGLHVGTFDYAESYGRGGAMLKVLVNPRDVVSVPNDSREKMRVSRYTVLEIIEAPTRSAVDDGRVNREQQYDIRVGDVFEDTDARRKGRQVKVTQVGDGAVTVAEKKPVTGTWLASKRPIRADRLMSRKYRRVRRGRKQA